MADAIDLAQLSRYTGGARALNEEILRLFDTQMTEMVAQLDGVVATRDARRWKEIAHTIKGAARGVGANAMGDAAAAAEPVDLADTENAGVALRRLTAEAGAVQTFIRDYLAA